MDITEKTRVPLFSVIVAMPILAGAVLWCGATNSRIASNEQRSDRIVDKLHTMESKEDRALEIVIDIRERLARIEAKINK